MLKKLTDGIMAGIMIALGGSVFLAVRAESLIAAAVLFSVALLCICFKGYSLFTGKVGYIVESHKKADFETLLLGLLGNLIGTYVCGLLISVPFKNYSALAKELCTAKMAQTVPEALIRALFCGILMYLAVSIYREKQSIAGILFCVPVFILSGFEHSIANMFYFAASGIVSFRAFLYLWLIIIGNAAGGMLLPALSLIGKEKNNA